MDKKESKQIVITKDTLLPLGLVITLLSGAIYVERIRWVTDQVTVRAAENTIQIKEQGKEIDEVKTKLLDTLSQINTRLAVLEGAKSNGKASK